MDALIGCSSKVDFKNKINDKVANFFFNYYGCILVQLKNLARQKETIFIRNPSL